jgi:hypothetical protein
MKSLLALFAIGLLSVYVAACGSTNKDSSSSASSTTNTPKTVSISTTPTDTAPAPAETKADADKDNDSAAGQFDDTNNDRVLDYGQAASAANARVITALVKRYYTAAYTENGAEACSMLYSTLEESVPEDYGQSPPGQPYMRGTTCAAVLTLLFKHFHPQLVAEYPKLQVARVRLIEHHGIVVLHFGTLPERQISVSREGHTWKVESLLDSEVP